MDWVFLGVHNCFQPYCSFCPDIAIIIDWVLKPHDLVAFYSTAHPEVYHTAAGY